jgi:hypothetical protein
VISFKNIIEERSLTEFILSKTKGFEMTGHSPLLPFGANARDPSPAFSIYVGERKLMNTLRLNRPHSMLNVLAYISPTR